jgi:hypothetical protein
MLKLTATATDHEFGGIHNVKHAMITSLLIWNMLDIAVIYVLPEVAEVTSVGVLG